MKKIKKLSLVLILAALMVIAAACGGAKEEAKDSGERWIERQGGRARTEAGRQASTCTAAIANAEPLRSTSSR